MHYGEAIVTPIVKDQAPILRRGPNSAPLFIASCGGGPCCRPTYLEALMPYIDAEISICSLQADDLDARLNTIEGMARRMVGMIRTIQPRGPYRIAGWFHGGIVAYEIAMQLLGADLDVDCVALIDTECPVASNNSLRRRVDNPEHPLIFTDADPSCCDLSKSAQPVGRSTNSLAQSTSDCENMCHVASGCYNLYTIPVPIRLFVTQQSNNATAFLGWDKVLSKELINVIRISPVHGLVKPLVFLEDLGRGLSKSMASPARTAAELDDKQYNPAVALRTAPRHNAACFLVPGAGSTVTSFIDLVTFLGGRHPVYGLQPRGLDGLLTPHSTVAAATDCYMKAIMTISADRPVHLLGHSFGGWVAFELARRLSETGRSVASLTLLDTCPPSWGAFMHEYNNTDVLMRWIEIFELILGRSTQIERNDIDVRSERDQIALLHDRLAKEGLLPRNSNPDILRGPLRTFATALRTPYMPPGEYLGAAQLILADDPRADRAANDHNHKTSVDQWKRWLPNLTFMHSPGNHLTMLRPPHVELLAELIYW